MKKNIIEKPRAYPVLNNFIENCPLCGSISLKKFAKIEDIQGQVQYLICNHCSLVLQSPQMDIKTQHEFYATKYRIFEFGHSEPPRIDIEIQTKRAKHLTKLLKPFDKHLYGNIHLDIGCGLGILLKEIQNSYGTISAGIEPDNIYREYTITKQNIPVYSDIYEWRNTNNASAHLITMSHVLEHLDNPISFLIFLRNHILDKEGLLLIEVPNLYFHSSLELTHPYAFTPFTLRESLIKTGFSVLYNKYHGVPVRFTPRYITIIAEPCKKMTLNSSCVYPKSKTVAFYRFLGINISQLEDSVVRLLRRNINFIKRILKKNTDKKNSS